MSSKILQFYNDIWEHSTTIKSDSPIRLMSKYTLFASLTNKYRLLTWSPDTPFTDEIFSLTLQQEGALLVIPNFVAGVLVDISLRSLRNKTFFSYANTIPYGFPDTSTFTFGTPIVFVEGIADRDWLVRLLSLQPLPFPLPTVVAVRSAAPSQSQLALLELISNKFILCLDNDETGLKRTDQLLKSLKERGNQVVTISQPFNLKDSGGYGDMVLDLQKSAIQFHYDFNISSDPALSMIRDHYVEQLHFALNNLK